MLSIFSCDIYSVCYPFTVIRKGTEKGDEWGEKIEDRVEWGRKKWKVRAQEKHTIGVKNTDTDLLLQACRFKGLFTQWECFVSGREENKHNQYISQYVFGDSRFRMVCWKTDQQEIRLCHQVIWQSGHLLYLFLLLSSWEKKHALHQMISKVCKFQQ